jgi:nitroreductase
MQSPVIPPDQWLKSLHWRYATKRFDPSRRIDAETWEMIEQSLVLTPSSFGLQPWKFIVVSSQGIKDLLPAISWGQSQPKDCSHMVVFASLQELTADHVDHFLEKIARVRSVPLTSLEGYRKVIMGFMDATRGQHAVWSAHQAYIALGQLMATAAALTSSSGWRMVLTQRESLVPSDTGTSMTAMQKMRKSDSHPKK